MKVKIKVYGYKGVLNRNFSSLEAAKKAARQMGEKHPHLLFIPEIHHASSGSQGREPGTDPSLSKTRPVDRSQLNQSEIDTSSWDEEIVRHFSD